ncbi:MAG: DUF484 family protein [Aliidongia sp.]
MLEPGDVDALLGPAKGRTARRRGRRRQPRSSVRAPGWSSRKALLRLTVDKAPPGLLALGSRRAGKFKAGQGTELLCFLAQTLGVTISQWLDL